MGISRGGVGPSLAHDGIYRVTELSLALSGLGGSVRTPVTKKLGAPKG
jgi:hypothetical protein